MYMLKFSFIHISACMLFDVVKKDDRHSLRHKTAVEPVNLRGGLLPSMRECLTIYPVTYFSESSPCRAPPSSYMPYSRFPVLALRLGKNTPACIFVPGSAWDPANVRRRRHVLPAWVAST